ncbi:hypothetical protein Tco_0335375 [Tanacetum coccineum]
MHATSLPPIRPRSGSFRNHFCVLGLSRYYDLDDDVYPTFLTDAGEEIDLFAFIRHADPAKVRIVGGNEQGGQNDNVNVVGAHKLNEESSGAEVGDQTEEGDHVVQDKEVNIVSDEDVQANVVDKPKRIRKKRKAVSGAGGSNLPPKKLREDHGTSVMSVLVPLGNPLPPFSIYLIVALWPQKPSLQTQLQDERFVISSNSSHHSSINVADDEVTSIVRSSILPPLLMAVAVAAIAVDGTYSVLVPGAGTGPAIQSLFAEFNVGEAEAAEAIRLHSQVATVKAAEADRVNELDDLKARHLALVGEKVCNCLLISDYELFKEQYEAVQDEQVKVLSDRVAGLDADLMVMALHLDEKFNPRFLTTIADRSLAIDNGIQTGWQRALTMEGPEGALLKLPPMILLWKESISPRSLPSPSYEQLFLPIHRMKDNAVIKETSLSDSLDAVHARVQKIKEGTSSCRLSISDIMGPLVKPLSFENLVGEASTSGVPTTVVVTTALSTTFAQTGSIPPISVSDYDAEPHAEAPPPAEIVFEKEELETTP